VSSDPIEGIAEASNFGELFYHDDDEAWLAILARAGSFDLVESG
jgi:hypothetical protein